MNEKEWEGLILYKKYDVIKKNGEKTRIQKEDDETGFEYGKGMRRRGWRRSKEYMLREFQLVEKNEDEAWKGRIRRVIKAIKSSGLWTEMLPYFNNLLCMQHEDLGAIRAIDNTRFARRWTGLDEKDLEKANDLFERDFVNYLHKYPFVFYKDHEGFYRINMDYISSLSEVKLKSTYFGKGNKAVKERIAKAIVEGVNLTEKWTVGYDVTYDLLSDKKKAWYSEEYRNCGNGHYYLAFDENVAVFYEDD